MVLPISYFERAGNAHFNSLVVVDSDGSVLQNYRKTHIPNGPGYQVQPAATPGRPGLSAHRRGRLTLAALAGKALLYTRGHGV